MCENGSGSPVLKGGENSRKPLVLACRFVIFLFVTHSQPFPVLPRRTNQAMHNSPNPHEEDFFGQELIINLYECDRKKITSEDAIRKFVIELTDDVLKMKRYGEPQIPHFGHNDPITSGYSLVQLIETSSITGHFSDAKGSCYLNIFSCAWYDPEKATAFCQDFFGAKRAETTFLKRA